MNEIFVFLNLFNELYFVIFSIVLCSIITNEETGYITRGFYESLILLKDTLHCRG